MCSNYTSLPQHALFMRRNKSSLFFNALTPSLTSFLEVLFKTLWKGSNSAFLYPYTDMNWRLPWGHKIEDCWQAVAVFWTIRRTVPSPCLYYKLAQHGAHFLQVFGKQVQLLVLDMIIIWLPITLIFNPQLKNAKSPWLWPLSVFTAQFLLAGLQLKLW